MSMTLTRRARFLTVAGLGAALALGTAGAALASTSGGYGGHHDKDAPHCVYVGLAGSAQSGYGKGAETYSATAKALVCEDKKGEVTVVKVWPGAADETEAGHHK